MTDSYKAARDFLLAHRTDYDTAYRDFRWPTLDRFNWALDWFDAEFAHGDTGERCALRIVGDGAASLTFAADRGLHRKTEPATDCRNNPDLGHAPMLLGHQKDVEIRAERATYISQQKIQRVERGWIKPLATDPDPACWRGADQSHNQSVPISNVSNVRGKPTRQ
jgi:hypothetical protein